VPVNSTLAVTAASVFIVLKSVLDPKAALNHGSFRPVNVIAPEGTIVNVTRPAPAGSHGEIRKRVIATMLGALAQVIPEKVSGDVHRTSFHNLIGGIHPTSGKEYVHYEWSSGGNGGFAEADGPSAMAAIDWGDLSTVQPSEVLETRFPLRVEWSALGEGTAGAGRQRGGQSMYRGLRVLADSATYSLLSDGAVLPAFGIEGGGPAAPVMSHVLRDGRRIEFPTPGKVGGFKLKRGDVLVIRSAGGGGFGDPLARVAELVAEDVREGYVTGGEAKQVYGVVLTAKGAPNIRATRALRQRLARQRFTLTTVPVETALYRGGQVSQRRVCPLNPADAKRAGLRTDDIVELMPPHGAPLRAWVQLDRKLKAGTVPIDAYARNVLRQGSGDRLWIRRLPT
jgi:N-methylhydantoinase B